MRAQKSLQASISIDQIAEERELHFTADECAAPGLGQKQNELPTPLGATLRLHGLHGTEVAVLATVTSLMAASRGSREEVADRTPDASSSRKSAHSRARSIVKSLYPFVWRTLRRSGIPVAEADDVAQEVFLTFYRRLPTIEPGTERRFLFRTAQYLALHARRSWARRRALETQAARATEPEAVSTPPASSRASEGAEATVELDRLLGRLPSSWRAVILLCEVEGLTAREAASVLGIPPGTVASRLRRSYQALTTLLEDGST